MNKEFVPYEEAVALKELGFYEPCFGSYYTNNKKFSTHDFIKEISDNSALFEPNYIINSNEDYYVAAPLWGQAFKWFRNNHNLIGLVNLEKEYLGKEDGIKKFKETGYYGYTISKIGEEYPISLGLDIEDSTYEEAEMACLKKLIDLTK